MLNKATIKQTLVVILLLASPALADPPHTRGGRVFEAWRLECGGGCVARTRVAAGGGTEVLGLAVAEGALAVRTPLPLHLPDGLALAFGDRPARRVAWRTCDRAGCEATLPADAEVLEAMRRERGGTAAFTLVTGEQVRLPFSLMGFSAALRALGGG